MNLAELKTKARAASARIEGRLTAAIDAGRELTAEEEAANAEDEAELTELNAQIAAGEPAAAGGKVSASVALAARATETERKRILALVDLCSTSTMSASLRTAIEDGQEAGAFAIGLAEAANARGASMDDLKDGAVQENQLPANGKGGAKGSPGQKKPGLADRLVTLGHKGMAHLKG